MKCINRTVQWVKPPRQSWHRTFPTHVKFPPRDFAGNPLTAQIHAPGNTPRLCQCRLVLNVLEICVKQSQHISFYVRLLLGLGTMFKFIYLFLSLFILRETETAPAGEGQRERERGKGRIPSRLHAARAEPDAGLELTKPRVGRLPE